MPVLVAANGCAEFSADGEGFARRARDRRTRAERAPYVSVARPYCSGNGGFTPSVLAARSGQAGSASSARASSTMSARPLAMISAACVG